MGKCKVCNDKGWYKDRCDCGGDDECFDCNGKGFSRVDCHVCNPTTVSLPFNKNKFWGWTVGIIVGIIAIALVDPDANDMVNLASVQYEVLSVYKGAVQVRDIQTGEIGQIFDNNLVKRALDGIIKKGDIIKFLKG